MKKQNMRLVKAIAIRLPNDSAVQVAPLEEVGMAVIRFTKPIESAAEFEKGKPKAKAETTRSHGKIKTQIYLGKEALSGLRKLLNSKLVSDFIDAM